MRAVRMVPVATASGSFHARVIAARLGAAGILCETSGGPAGTYPLGGCVEILVPEEEAGEARDLLAADAAEAALAARVDSAFPDDDPAGGRGRPSLPVAAGWVGVICLVLLVAVGALAVGA